MGTDETREPRSTGGRVRQPRADGGDRGPESLPFADKAGVVRLLTATRLPARHGKVIHACIGGRLDTSPLLFESARECLRERGLSIEDAVTQPDEDGRIALVIHNHSLLSVSLEEGERLGEAQKMSALDIPDEVTEAEVAVVEAKEG